MAADSANILVAGKGYAYTAPVGTTAPTSPYTAWSAASADWVDLATLLEDDGLTESRDQDRTEIKGWGLGTVRIVKSSQTITFKVTMAETKAETLSLAFGVPLADMTSTGTGASQFLSFVEGGNTEPDIRMLGFDILDGSKPVRLIIARAELTNLDDVVYKNDQSVNYSATITALTSPDESSITRMYGLVELPA
jgi:hypothetical protein